MGIYIKGLKLPECGEKIIVLTSSGYVEDVSGQVIEGVEAVHVPPHGDLIDRYDIKNKKITIDYEEWDDTFEDGLLFVTDLIDNAPTIIPAEEGELDGSL